MPPPCLVVVLVTLDDLIQVCHSTRQILQVLLGNGPEYPQIRLPELGKVRKDGVENGNNILVQMMKLDEIQPNDVKRTYCHQNIA